MSRPTVLRIPAPADFSFWRTAYSHGWCDLPPFAFDPAAHTLSRVFLLSAGRIVPCTLSGPGPVVRCACSTVNPLSPAERRELSQQIRIALRMDEDFSGFHREARRHPAYRWIARARAGRLLRAPTVFEDAVKMICTTNCTWALTTIMVRALVAKFGPTCNGATAFPSPAAIAGASEATLRRECSTGYRSRALMELSTRVAEGTLHIEQWRSSPAPTEELFAEMCTVRGIGPYAAGNLLRLAGRYEHLGLDSWVRSKWCELHSRGRKVHDRKIEAFYEPYGIWRGLFFWLEMTRDWHADKFTPPRA